MQHGLMRNVRYSFPVRSRWRCAIRSIVAERGIILEPRRFRLLFGSLQTSAGVAAVGGRRRDRTAARAARVGRDSKVLRDEARTRIQRNAGSEVVANVQSREYRRKIRHIAAGGLLQCNFL